MKNECPNYYSVGVMTRNGVHIVECSDLIDALILKNNINHYSAFLYGNVIKYLFRCGSKESMIKDLRKAQNYIEQLIDETVADNYATDSAED